MAAISGKQGKVEYDGKHVRFANWNLDADSNMLDVTEFSTSTGAAVWRDFIAGLSGWTFTADGPWRLNDSTGQVDLQANFLTPASATVKLYVDKEGGENYTGTAFISAVSVASPIDDRATFNVTAQGTGSLTYSTAT